MYNGGESESIVGRWLQDHPAERRGLVVATKAFFGNPAVPNAAGLGRKHLFDAVEGSLARLQCGCIDLFQIHSYDARTPVEVWMQTVAELIASGKVRMLGVSNVLGWQLQRIVEEAARLGVPLVSLQAQYSLLARGVELELLDCCEHNGIAFLPWSPLKGGWLTGKFSRDAPPSDESRVGKVEAGSQPKMQSAPNWSDFASNEQTWALIDAMAELAAAKGATVPQIAIAWLLGRPAVVSVVIGVRNVQQFDDNAGASTVELTEEEASRLSALSAGPIPYPYEMVWRTSARGIDRLDGTLFPRTQRRR